MQAGREDALALPVSQQSGDPQRWLWALTEPLPAAPYAPDSAHVMGIPVAPWDLPRGSQESAWKASACPLPGHCLSSMGWVTDSAVPTPELQGRELSPSGPSPAAARGTSRRSTAPSRRWREAALDANTEQEAPADSTITQGSPSLLLNGRHFSVSFPLPLELKPPFCSKTHQAKEILLPFQLTNSPPSSASGNAHPTGHPFPRVCHVARGKNGPHPLSCRWHHVPGLP